MRHAHILILAGSLSLLLAGPVLRAQPVVLTDAAKLQLQVDALFKLNDLNLTPQQLSALSDLASDTAGTLSDAPAPISADYRAALKDMRDALLSKDQDRIESAEDKMGDIEDKQDPDSDPDIDQSDSARTKAVAYFKTLSVKQFANYVSENSDDVDDPAQLLIDALHQSRGMSDDDFQSLRDDTAQELGILSAGPHPDRPPRIIARVNQFLTRAHRLPAGEYAQQQNSLEEAARKMVDGMDPAMCLRNWMENELADLLSNPQLSLAISSWQAAGKQ
jgi:hypothetical protein